MVRHANDGLVTRHSHTCQDNTSHIQSDTSSSKETATVQHGSSLLMFLHNMARYNSCFISLSSSSSFHRQFHLRQISLTEKVHILQATDSQKSSKKKTEPLTQYEDSQSPLSTPPFDLVCSIWQTRSVILSHIAQVKNKTMSIPLTITSEKQGKKKKIVEKSLIDSRAGGNFIDQNYAKAQGFELTLLPEPI